MMPAFDATDSVHGTRGRDTFQARGLPKANRGGAAMKKAPLYSRSRHRSGAPTEVQGAARSRDASTATPSPTSPAAAAGEPVAAARPTRRARWHAAASRHRLKLATLAAAMLVLLGGIGGRALVAPPIVLTQKDIDSAVRHSLEKEPLPSAYAKAYAA